MFIKYDKHKMNTYSIDNLIKVYKSLETHVTPAYQTYVVYSYFLYNEPNKIGDNKIGDNKIGKHIYLGAYPTMKKAIIVANYLKKKTGYDYIYVTKSCNWSDIRSTVDNSIKMVTTELDNMIPSGIDNIITSAIDNIKLTDNIESQAKSWFNLIVAKANYEYHKQRIEYYKREVEQLQKKVTPDRNWLSYYKKILYNKGQQDLYIMLEEGYKSFN